MIQNATNIQSNMLGWVQSSLNNVDGRGLVSTAILGAPLDLPPVVPQPLFDIPGYPIHAHRDLSSGMTGRQTIEYGPAVKRAVEMHGAAVTLATGELKKYGARAQGDSPTMRGLSLASSIDATIADSNRMRYRDFFSRIQAATFLLEAGDLIGAARHFIDASQHKASSLDLAAMAISAEMAAGLLRFVSEGRMDAIEMQKASEMSLDAESGMDFTNIARNRNEAIREVFREKITDNLRLRLRSARYK